MKKFLLLFLLLVPVSASAQTYEVGAGGYFNEDEAIDVSAFRGWFTLGGVELPLPGGVASGVTAELGYSSALLWSVWNVNRTEMKRVIAGADVRIAKGGPVDGSKFDFAYRVVAGFRFTDNLAFYSYFLEDQTPVGFALGWKF